MSLAAELARRARESVRPRSRSEPSGWTPQAIVGLVAAVGGIATGVAGLTRSHDNPEPVGYARASEVADMRDELWAARRQAGDAADAARAARSQAAGCNERLDALETQAARAASRKRGLAPPQ